MAEKISIRSNSLYDDEPPPIGRSAMDRLYPGYDGLHPDGQDYFDEVTVKDWIATHEVPDAPPEVSHVTLGSGSNLRDVADLFGARYVQDKVRSGVTTLVIGVETKLVSAGKKVMQVFPTPGKGSR